MPILPENTELTLQYDYDVIKASRCLSIRLPLNQSVFSQMPRDKGLFEYERLSEHAIPPTPSVVRNLLLK
jgi:hypothetical protein